MKTKTPTLKTLVVSANDKGGVTKSASIGALIDALETLGYKVKTVDGDIANQTQKQIRPDAEVIDTDQEEALDDLLSSCATADEDLTVLDMPGTSGKLLKDYFAASGFEFLNDMGLRLVIGLAITDTADAIDGAISWVEAFADRAEFILLANERDTPFGNSFDLGGHNDTQDLVDVSEGRIITIPRLTEPMKSQYDKHKAPPSAFSPGRPAAKALKLSMPAAGRWRNFSNKVARSVEPHAPWITGLPVPKPLPAMTPEGTPPISPQSQALVEKLIKERDKRRNKS